MQAKTLFCHIWRSVKEGDRSPSPRSEALLCLTRVIEHAKLNDRKTMLTFTKEELRAIPFRHKIYAGNANVAP